MAAHFINKQISFLVKKSGDISRGSFAIKFREKFHELLQDERFYDVEVVNSKSKKKRAQFCPKRNEVNKDNIQKSLLETSGPLYPYCIQDYNSVEKDKSQWFRDPECKKFIFITEYQTSDMSFIEDPKDKVDLVK